MKLKLQLKKILVNIDIILFNIAIILVGNKNDLYLEQAITEEEESNYADKKNIIHLRTSAKTGFNIKELFKTIGNKIFENFPVDENPVQINENENEDQIKGACCLCCFKKK